MSQAGRAAACLLWEAGRLKPRPDVVRVALDEGAAIATVAPLATAHGLGPLLWRALRMAGCRDGVGPGAAQLASEAALCRHRDLLVLPNAVATAVRPLLDAGLEPVVFKGPAVACRYPEPGLRPMGDIDLILPPELHQLGLAALQQAGWTIVRPADQRRYETVLAHQDVPGLYAELHRELDVWYHRPNRLRAQTLWRRRIAINCLGTPAFGLRPEDEVVALAAHAGKPYHYFSRLIWSVDLAVVDEAARAGGRELDWDLVLGLADAWRCRTVVAVALLHAARLGVAVPPELTGLAGSAVRRAALAPLLDFEWPVLERNDGLRNRLRYALVDEWPRRLVLFAGSPAPAPGRQWPAEWARLGFRAMRRAWRLRRSSDPGGTKLRSP